MSEAASQGSRTIDVGNLPRSAIGFRTPLWWGTVLLILIESTCFAILFTSYFYLRNNFHEWPPAPHLAPLPCAAMALGLVATLVPTWLYRAAAREKRFAEMRRWLTVTVLLSFVSVALRVWEFHALPFSWTDNAYTSVVWVSLGTHTLEIVTGAVESAFLLLILFRERVEEKTFEDVEATGLFWYFSVLVWLPFALAFYIEALPS